VYGKQFSTSAADAEIAADDTGFGFNPLNDHGDDALSIAQSAYSDSSGVCSTSSSRVSFGTRYLNSSSHLSDHRGTFTRDVEDSKNSLDGFRKISDGGK
jgi:hypothetical protein